MRRVLFQWRGIKIHAYPAMLYLGLVLGVIGGTYAATLHGLDPVRIYAAMLLLVLPALVGARLLFVAAHWAIYRREPRRIWQRSEGGAAMYGGLVLAFLLSVPLLSAMGIPIGAFWDAAIITILIGMVFTRVGCLLNGCCTGRPSEGPLTLCLPNVHGVWRQRLPTQLLEAGLGAMLLLGSILAWNRLPFDGALFLLNVAGYGIGRWGLEVTRERMDRVGTVSLQRAISVGLVAVAIGTFLLIWLLGPGTGWRPSPAMAERELGHRISPWSFFIAPLAVLAVLLLFRFVGCDLVFVIDAPSSYVSAVGDDAPVAWWRMEEPPPPLATTADGVTADDETGGHDGTYQVPSPPIPPGPNSVGGDLLVLGEPGLIPVAGNHAIRVQGGFVRVPNGSALTQAPFTLEAVVSPEWDFQETGRFFTLLSSRLQAANQGFALYAGPLDPQTNLEYHWQLWVHTSAGTIEQLKATSTGDPAVDPGLKAERKTTYLALTFDGTTFFLHLYYPGRDISFLRYELGPPSGAYIPNDPAADFLIGVDGPFENQQPEQSFPFSGKIDEVAIYDKVLTVDRITTHGLGAFEDL